MDKWKCSRCNYIFVGKESPKLCPNCGHRCDFDLYDEEVPPFTQLYDE